MEGFNDHTESKIAHAKDVITSFCSRHINPNTDSEHYNFCTDEYVGWHSDPVVSGQTITREEANYLLREFCKAISPDNPSANQAFAYWPTSQ